MPALFVNLTGISHITGLTIRNATNYDYWFSSNYPLYYDDFTFTPELSANITNPRVNGGLDQTNQNALLGADVVLQASTSHPGGTYSWTFTPDNLVSIASGSQNSSAVTIRTSNTGTINAKLTYMRNGVSVSPSFTLNSILPTVTSFTAQQISDRITFPYFWGDDKGWWWYRLCCTSAQQLEGIEFNATGSLQLKRQRISDIGDEAYAGGYGSANVEFRRGKFTIYISTYADVDSDSDASMLTQEQRFEREKTEKRRLSMEFAKLAAGVIDAP